jgi:hypothetical protein
MARLLVYTAPATGHVFPSTELVLELHRRGHEGPRSHPVCRRGPPQSGPNSCRADRPAHRGQRARRLESFSPDRGASALATLVWTHAKVEIVDLRGATDQVRPDALIVDANFQGGAAMAEASGLPWCQYSPLSPVFQSNDAPPYGPGLAPADGPLRDVSDRALNAILGPLADHYLPPVNAPRAGLGLAPLHHLEEIFLRSQRLILFTVQPLEYPRSDWPASLRLVGPLSWQPPATPVTPTSKRAFATDAPTWPAPMTPTSSARSDLTAGHVAAVFRSVAGARGSMCLLTVPMTFSVG